jgi:hypothetical protein
MDTFKELSPDEQRLAVLQFMGQHLTGDLKELDQNLISGSASLKGMSIDPVQLIKSMPRNNTPQDPNVVNAGINASVPHQHVQAVQLPAQQVPYNDPDQLEFDFNNSNYAKLIFDRLDSIDNKINKILDIKD